MITAVGATLLALLGAAQPQAKGGAVPEFAAFPSGAIAFGRMAHPGRGIEETQSLLRESGHFGLAGGIEDLFYRDRTEDDGTAQSLGDLLGSILDPTLSPLVSSYLTNLEDWGRGARPEATRRAMLALESGEFAIYPGGKSLQLLRGDTAAWLGVVKEKGPVRKIEGEGKTEILEIDAGRRSRFVAALPGGVVLRSQDLPLLQRALSLARGESRESSLRSTPLAKESVPGSQMRIVCLIDGPTLLRELAENASISDALLPWIREAFRGLRGLRYSLESMEAHLDLLADPGAPLLALLGVGSISSFPPNGLSDRPLGRVGLRLDLGKVLETVAQRGAGDDEEESPFGPKAIAKMIANLDLSRARLWVSDSDRAVLCVGANDGALLESAWALGAAMASMIPGIGFEKKTVEGGEILSWTRPGEQRAEIFAMARRGNWLLAAGGSADAEELMERLRADASFLDEARFGGAAFRSQGKDFLADLSPLASAWTGALWVQCLLAPGARPATSLRLDLGIRPDAWKRVTQLWSAAKENRPGWQSKLEAALFGEYEPAQSVGEFSARWTKKKDRIVAASGDRLRIEWSFDFVRPLLAAGPPDKEDGEAFRAAAEAGLRQKPAPSEKFPESASAEIALDLEPFYDEVVRNPALFRGFVQVATQSWNWPWFSLRSKQHIVVYPQAKGLRIDAETNRDPGLGSLLSTLFDRYPPSAREERAIARTVAVGEAQRIFQSAKGQDLNGNGAGEFASLRALLQSGATPVPLASLFPGAAAAGGSDLVEEGYRYRLLLPKDRSEQEKRWCLFVFPEVVDLEHHLVFYTDERGLLMAGWQVMNDQMEFEAKDLYALSALTLGQLSVPPSFAKVAQFQRFCLESQAPPPHREVYDYFLPYLPLYGGRLQQGD